MEELKKKKVVISLDVDEFCLADSLRDIAAIVEDSDCKDNSLRVETEHCIGNIHGWKNYVED